MGFRGIFLHRCPGTEEGSAAKFTVLCTEAELCLLVERHEASDIDPSGVVDTKVLVKNSSTTDLLFVARMADVTMEVGSMFWVDGTTVYCFRFSSDNSFAEVQRAVHALRRTEQLALMRSVLSFHPLGNTANDGKDKGAKWKHYSECANLDSSQGAEELPVDNNHVVAIPKPSKPRKLVVDKVLPPSSSKKKAKPMPPAHAPAKLAELDQGPPPLKRSKSTNDTTALDDKRRIAEVKAFNRQWLITIGARNPSSGPSCHLCHRRQGKMFQCPNGVLDHIYCGRCLHYKFNENLNDFMDRGLQYSCRLCAGTCDCSVCSGRATSFARRHPSIPSNACLVCGTTSSQLTSHPHLPPAQLCAICVDSVAKMPGTGCLVCGSSDENDPIRPCAHCNKACCVACVLKLGTGGCPFCIAPTSSEALSLPTSVELEVPSWPPVDPQDSLTYFTSYAQAVIHRETRRTPPKLSEDSCFCCKDGGDLIECDFKAKIKCPKVYHVGTFDTYLVLEPKFTFFVCIPQLN
ncbi:hypothetical protein, variant [Aphanomyces astaci]|uniref:RING-type domain-containing protein n=1 Tax=Aphanomyces astaci TaxID=112090 RepID=W4G830_APHAT|nr:hypothetical protein, variant [Aphanomyces astaci]ETV75835.1 hypothetical protein, variant [Aphanomyces astaci]|eukprot:XP_009834966.1 hypothetical protein, variant [Aphanomyces astaci]